MTLSWRELVRRGLQEDLQWRSLTTDPSGLGYSILDVVQASKERDMQQKWDAVIAGAGPAGASCAIWLRHLGFNPLLIEASGRVGGLVAANPFPDIWTASSPGMTGEQIAQQIAVHLKSSQVPLRLSSPVTDVKLTESGLVIHVRSMNQIETLSSRTFVIATGVRPRGLHPGDTRKWPGVIVGPGEPIANQDFTGMSVAILGGGDNGFENYEYVRQRGARQVHLYARSVRAQKQFVMRTDTADIRVGPYAVDPQARSVNGRVYDLILVFYGWEPELGFMPSLNVQLDARGFVYTDPATTQTSVPQVYAIGEVAQRMHPCMVTAMADGVVAAKAIEKLLSN